MIYIIIYVLIGFIPAHKNSLKSFNELNKKYPINQNTLIRSFTFGFIFILTLAIWPLLIIDYIIDKRKGAYNDKI